MSFWDFLTDETEDEKRATKQKLKPMNLMVNGFSSGVENNKFTVEQVLSIPSAKACCDIIVNSIKTLPIELYEIKSEGVIERVLNDYRLNLLNDKPNIIATGNDFKEKLARDILLHGNAYVEVVKDKNTIKGVWNVDPTKITIRKLANKQNPILIEDVIINISGSSINFSLEDFIICTNNSEDNGLTGKGVIARGGKTIELALNEIELSKNLMKNGSVLNGIIYYDKALSQEAKINLKNGWNKLYSGSDSAGKTAILENGLKYDKLSYSPNELGLTASRSKTTSDMCNLFNVPEQMIEASANTYGSVESMSIRFLQYSVSPILAIIESSLNRSLLLEKEKGSFFFKFNTDDIIKTTQAERYQTLKMGIDGGILSQNEARLKENLPPVPDDFIKLSLGAVMYYPDKRQLFVPNMSTVFSSDSNEIISSPELAKEKLLNKDINNLSENNKKLKQNEGEDKENEKLNVDD